jgi:predicted XRE-type DNA-binding protein
MSKARSTKSSGNVFADIGVPDAQVHLAKADLVIGIAAIIKSKGLSQTAAAKLMGIAQPDVSRLMRGHFEGFSYDRLFDFLNALGERVHVVVTEANRWMIERERDRLRAVFCCVHRVDSTAAGRWNIIFASGPNHVFSNPWAACNAAGGYLHLQFINKSVNAIVILRRCLVFGIHSRSTRTRSANGFRRMDV